MKISNEKRDTKFRGFAKLLMLDLDIGLENDFTRQIIAQRAYDLVEHALSTVNDNDNLMMGMYYIEGIPDLTVWPDSEK